MTGTLIVGASQAGVDLAAALRQAGDTGGITLVGGEPHAPYQRPPLSKAFLLGEATADTLALRAERFYAERAIDVVAGERVTDVELATGRDGSGTAVTDRGRVLAFERLALAVGARPRRLEVPGVDLDGVRYLRTIDDAAALRRHLAHASRVVVVGGGFIGLEVAAAARSLRLGVTVVEAADRLMVRSVAPAVSRFYLDAHARRGVDVKLGAGVVALAGTGGKVSGVELSDGTGVAADLVVIGVGIVPRTGLARRMRLACQGGIVVDALGRTSEPPVVAAGDCTVFPHPVAGVGLTRLESVPHAQSQARIAAATLLGQPAPAPAVPWFWSDQYDLKLQIAGLPDGYDQVVVRRGPRAESMSVLYYRGGSLLAVNAVNRVADYVAARRALSAGATIPADRAADSAAPLMSLMSPVS